MLNNSLAEKNIFLYLADISFCTKRRHSNVHGES